MCKFEAGNQSTTPRSDYKVEVVGLRKKEGPIKAQNQEELGGKRKKIKGDWVHKETATFTR